jgi:preprotein translocase subunit SecG
MTWINLSIDVLIAVLIVACPLLCLVIMMQRSKQEGLGAAFGGGITESVWGAQTSNVLVKATCILAGTFFIVSILLARLYTDRAHILEKPSSLQEQLLKPVPMTATNAAGTPLVPTATPMTPDAPAAANAVKSPAAATSTTAAPKAK